MIKSWMVIFLLAAIWSMSCGASCYADGGGPMKGLPGQNIKQTCVDNFNNAQTDNFSPLIEGTFVASKDINASKFTTHVTLRGSKYESGGEQAYTYLYTVTVPIINSKHICTYTIEELMEKYKYAACIYGVGEQLGYDSNKYYPVVTDIQITQKDDCPLDAVGQAMISGTAKIRISAIALSGKK